MSSRVLYVSHGIKGKSEAEIVADEQAGTRWALEHGLAALLPRTIPVWEHPGEPCPPGPGAGQDGGHNWGCYMRSDLLVMLQYASAILMMPGWELSNGARFELNTALTVAMPVHFYPKDNL